MLQLLLHVYAIVSRKHATVVWHPVRCYEYQCNSAEASNSAKYRVLTSHAARDVKAALMSLLTFVQPSVDPDCSAAPAQYCLQLAYIQTAAVIHQNI